MNHWKNPYFLKWLIYAPIGFSLFGFGISFLDEVGNMKHQGVDFWTWFSLGTLSLIVTNAGLAFVGDAVKNRVLYELEKKQNKPEVES